MSSNGGEKDRNNCVVPDRTIATDGGLKMKILQLSWINISYGKMLRIFKTLPKLALEIFKNTFL